MFKNAAFSLLLIFVCTVTYGQNECVNNRIQKIYDVSGYVAGYDKEGKLVRTGSCFFIECKDKEGNKHVFAITNMHVATRFNPDKTVIKKIQDGKTYEKKILPIYNNLFEDFCIVYVKNTKDFRLHNIKINDKLPKIGQCLESISCPLSYSYFYARGYLSNQEYKIANKKIYGANILIYPGSSGGGVFTGDLELVGINTLTPVIKQLPVVDKNNRKISILGSGMALLVRNKTIYKCLKDTELKFLLTDEKIVSDKILEVIKK